MFIVDNIKISIRWFIAYINVFCSSIKFLIWFLEINFLLVSCFFQNLSKFSVNFKFSSFKYNSCCFLINILNMFNLNILKLLYYVCSYVKCNLNTDYWSDLKHYLCFHFIGASNAVHIPHAKVCIPSLLLLEIPNALRNLK